MKYSFIVSVYNGEKYVDACLQSLVNQTYRNFEIIVINDGSTDSTQEHIGKWVQTYPDYFVFINRENKGLSASRNEGIQKATGDYILFVDHDDTMDAHTLETLEHYTKCKPDLIRFGYALYYSDKPAVPVQTNYQEGIYTGEEAFQTFVASPFLFEMATLYAYRLAYMKENQLYFTEGRYHEDFGLIPYSIIKAQSVQIINDILYHYLQSENSITRNTDYQKTVQKANDILSYTVELRNQVEKIPIQKKTQKLFKSFLANAVLNVYPHLEKKEALAYKKKIKEYKIVNDLMDDTMARKIKKLRKKISI